VRARLGDILVSQGVITEDQLKEALAVQRTRNRRLGPVLVDLGFATPTQVAQAAARQLGMPLLRLRDLVPDDAALSRLPPRYCQANGILPVRDDSGRLLLAMVNPFDLSVLDFARGRLGQIIEPAVANELDVINVLAHRFGARDLIDNLVDQLGTREGFEFVGAAGEHYVLEGLEGDSAPTVRIVSTVIADAIESQASDIHIEPRAEGVQVRFRIDGRLRDAIFLPPYTHAAVVSRIKVMADMDIAEKRAPQDGHLKVRYLDRVVDLRVSTLPTAYGEKAVLRVLDKSTRSVSLEAAGFGERACRQIEDALALPQGLVLATGPTGSGKTTTLYTCLGLVKDEHSNIVTIEDPIEQYIAGVNQVQVLEAADMTFANGLRSILRQDPDIVMVGEIRDRETAEIAMRASLTGHRVLSTLHTNDAVSSITRLLDLGIDSYLIASSLTLVIAQRLVRLTCRACRQPYEPDARIIERVERSIGRRPAGVFMRGIGCESCAGTGFAGRTVIYEVLPVSDEVRRLIGAEAGELEVLAAACSEGMASMFASGVGLAQRGVTTLEEVITCVPPPKWVGEIAAREAARAAGEDRGELPVWGPPPGQRGDGRHHQVPAAPGGPVRVAARTAEAIPLGLSGLPVPIRATRRPRVLVAESDECRRRALCAIVRQGGYDTIEALNGRMALRLAGGLAPDIIVVGAELPDLDGLSVCAELGMAEASARIPVVFVTSAEDADGLQQAKLVGADECIVCPLDQEAALACLGRLVGGRSQACAETETSTVASALADVPAEGARG